MPHPTPGKSGGSTAGPPAAKIAAMKRPLPLLLLAQVAILAAFALALRSGRVPLGVVGEWEWQRIKVAPGSVRLAMAGAAIAGFAAFAALGMRALGRKGKVGREVGWVLGLVVAAVVVQGAAQEGAPEGYGLSKWILALHAPGSSGYYTVAKGQMGDPRRFLADYPAWIARQDALHVGTHPPGLFLVARGMLALAEANPGLARAVLDLAPGSVSAAAQALRAVGDLPRADAAALTLTGALTLLMCASTVAPLYALARASLPAPLAWAAACLWPLAPSALLFQPTADSAFPLLSTSALALATWAGRSDRRSSLVLAGMSGLVLAVGMEFTLAFLPVGLVVALILATPPGSGVGRGVALIAATGTGFVALTLLWWAGTRSDPVATWWVNQRNHARFYVEYPRSYLAWALVNPVELAVGLGLPASAWAVVGMAGARRWPRATTATLAVLALLTLSGRNLSEVGRLWLPLMPPLLMAAAAGLDRAGGGPKALAATIGLVGVEVLVLEATIQVVYPI